ncbi:hypothetical protein Hanom_Chr08g00727961 [Helianthus anomalus]
MLRINLVFYSLQLYASKKKWFRTLFIRSFLYISSSKAVLLCIFSNHKINYIFLISNLYILHISLFH